jgi:hypothetical protein
MASPAPGPTACSPGTRPSATPLSSRGPAAQDLAGDHQHVSGREDADVLLPNWSGEVLSKYEFEYSEPCELARLRVDHSEGQFGGQNGASKG